MAAKYVFHTSLVKVEKQGPYEHKTAEVVWRYLMCGNCGKSASASFIPPTFNRWPLEQKPKAKEHFKAHLKQNAVVRTVS